MGGAYFRREICVSKSDGLIIIVNIYKELESSDSKQWRETFQLRLRFAALPDRFTAHLSTFFGPFLPCLHDCNKFVSTFDCFLRKTTCSLLCSCSGVVFLTNWRSYCQATFANHKSKITKVWHSLTSLESVPKIYGSSSSQVEKGILLKSSLLDTRTQEYVHNKYVYLLQIPPTLYEYCSHAFKVTFHIWRLARIWLAKFTYDRPSDSGPRNWGGDSLFPNPLRSRPSFPQLFSSLPPSESLVQAPSIFDLMGCWPIAMRAKGLIVSALYNMDLSRESQCFIGDETKHPWIFNTQDIFYFLPQTGGGISTFALKGEIWTGIIIIVFPCYLSSHKVK